tara:strand:+ start:78 stop:485 length:408 start_codon:yes stop_codon:yes gene_type:complete
MYYKENEIKEYAIETIKERLEYNENYLDHDITDIHHDLFNTDYYLVYYSACNEWLGSHVFECIEKIKEYEETNFGEVTTDLSNSENVVNMYVYIVGEYILSDVLKEFKQDKLVDLILDRGCNDEINKLWKDIRTA